MAKLYEKEIETQLKSIKKNLSKNNYEILNKWANDLVSENLSVRRITKLLQMVKQMALFLEKDLDKTTKEDIQKLVIQINKGVLPNCMENKVNNFSRLKKDNYSETTQNSYKIVLKKFYKWLEGNNEDYPIKVKWIKKKAIAISEKYKTEREEFLKENILSVEEVKNLIETANNKRDKALITLVFETGCRIGEALEIKVKDVKFTETTTDLTLNGKTGTRKIPIVVSTSYLKEYLNEKNEIKGEDILFTKLNNKSRLEYPRVRKILRELYSKAGIKKASNPHILRHSQATLKSRKWTEGVMRKYFGWSKTSGMPAFYSHLGDQVLKDLVEEEHKLNGNGEKAKEFENPICPRCKNPSKITDKFCSVCAFALDQEVSNQIQAIEQSSQEVFDKLSPEIKGKIIELVQSGI